MREILCYRIFFKQALRGHDWVTIPHGYIFKVIADKHTVQLAQQNKPLPQAAAEPLANLPDHFEQLKV